MDLDRLLIWMEPWIDATYSAPAFDPNAAEDVLAASGRSREEHSRLLQRWNGFYALNGALHVLGACNAPPNHSLSAWNEPTGWRAAWGRYTEGLTFFAQGAFGDQFAYRAGKIVRFHAKNGRSDVMQATLAEWIEAVLLEPDYTLNQRFFEECVRAHGPLPHGGLFVPNAGSSFDEPGTPERMHVVPARDAMEMYAVSASRPVRRTSSASMRPSKL